ncbi:MAG: hypothetical protein ACFFD4_27340 [Candidatus Odinarchaeota archaeon]
MSESEQTGEETKKDSHLNIIHFFILEDRGLPFFIRNYSESTFSKIDPLILSGFISAMETFAVTNMASRVTDIGLKSLRLYLMHVEDLIYVLAVKAKENNLSSPDSSQIITVLEKLQDAFKLLMEVFQLSDNFDRSSILSNEDLLASFGSTADNIILEGTKEYEETTGPEFDLFGDEDSYLTDEYIGKLEKVEVSEAENLILDAFKSIFKEDTGDSSEE